MHLKELAFSLSLSHLVFLRVYYDLSVINSSAKNQYFVEALPSAINYLALIINICGLAAVLTALAASARRVPRGLVARAIWPLTCVILSVVASMAVLRVEGWISTAFLTHIRSLLPSLYSLPSLVMLGLALAIAGGTFILVRWRRTLLKVTVFMLIILSPGALVTIWQSTLFAMNNRDMPYAAEALPRRAKSMVKSETPRVVVLLFDELDYRLTFGARPAILRLPEPPVPM